MSPERAGSLCRRIIRGTKLGGKFLFSILFHHVDAGVTVAVKEKYEAGYGILSA